MSDLLLLSQLATEAMNTENMTENATRNRGPSPTTTGVLPMPGQRPFVFDSSLQQAANITPFAMQDGAQQETARMWQVGRLPAGGTGAFQNLGPNINQGINEEFEGQAKPRGIVIPVFATDGLFTKACLQLGSNENLVKEADTTSQLFTAWFSEETQVRRFERIQKVGDQLAPFPMLAVNAADNTVCVLHGVKKFAASFGTQHPNEDDVLAFKNDTNEQSKDFPQIVKIDSMDWYEATYWLHPNQTIIETTNAQYSQVISLSASSAGVNTSKIIPIPLFLVSFFMNGGFPRSALATCQAFHTIIFHNASNDLQHHLKHVRNFLLVAAGAEAHPQDATKLPVSQLAIKMEIVPLDQVIQPWAEHQLSKITPAAAAFDARKAPPDNARSPHVNQQETRMLGRNANGWDPQMPAMMTNAGVQQQGSNSMGITSINEDNALRHNHQGGNRNENAEHYPEYVQERERTMNVQNTNVGHQHPVSYTNYNPAYGRVDRQHTFWEGPNQQVQLGTVSHIGQAEMSNNQYNIHHAVPQENSHRYGRNPHETSRSSIWGQGNPVGHQTGRHYMSHHENNEMQLRNGAAYPGEKILARIRSKRNKVTWEGCNSTHHRITCHKGINIGPQPTSLKPTNMTTGEHIRIDIHKIITQIRS